MTTYGQKIMAADMCGCGNAALGVRSQEISLKSMAPGIKNRDAAAMPTKVCPLARFFLIYSPIPASTLVGCRSMAAGTRQQAAVRSWSRVFCGYGEMFSGVRSREHPLACALEVQGYYVICLACGGLFEVADLLTLFSYAAAK